MPPAGPPADRSSGRADRAQSDRKQEVVAMAKRLFAERGVRQTTVREIGANVGILSGSLYHHFGSKDDLVDYIVRDFCDAVLKRYDEIIALDVDSPTKLRAMARYAFSLIGSAPDEVAIVADEYLYAPTAGTAPSRFDYVVRFNAKVGQHWYDVLESGVEAGEFRSSIHARSLYRLVRDAIMGATRWWVPSKDMTTDDIADALVDIVLKGIVRRAA